MFSSTHNQVFFYGTFYFEYVTRQCVFKKCQNLFIHALHHIKMRNNGNDAEASSGSSNQLF